MTIATFTKAELALLAWRNAPAGARTPSGTPSKPFLAMKCLALVVRNRVRAGWHGGDWLAVIANDPIYSAYLPEPILSGLELPGYPDPRDDVWQRFLWEVDRVYDGTAQDVMTEAALWWAELDKINRPWFLEQIARKPEEHPRVAQCGPLTLFR